MTNVDYHPGQPDRKVVISGKDAKQGDAKQWTARRVLKYSLIMAIIAGVVLYAAYFGNPNVADDGPAIKSPSAVTQPSTPPSAPATPPANEAAPTPAQPQQPSPSTAP